MDCDHTLAEAFFFYTELITLEKVWIQQLSRNYR